MQGAGTNRVPDPECPIHSGECSSGHATDLVSDRDHDTGPPDISLYDAVMVVHGPEVFDSGALSVLYEQVNPGRVIVTGVMARTAAEESCLPVEYRAEPPSRVINSLASPSYLVCEGKTPLSGRTFGDIVAGRIGRDRGLIQLECMAGVLYRWGNGNLLLTGQLSERTGFPVQRVRVSDTRIDGLREIRGCIPGEPVFVNGFVVGLATAETVVLRQSAGGGIRVVEGLSPKAHGLEKLSRGSVPDLSTAWCKSGPVRGRGPHGCPRRRTNGRVLVVDHCAHRIYEQLSGDICGILSIGDDTTAVCGHIGAALGIPVLGVVDRDKDGIVPEAYTMGSVILVAGPGERDDGIGREVAGLLTGDEVRWDAWVEEICAYLGNRVRAEYPRG